MKSIFRWGNCPYSLRAMFFLLALGYICKAQQPIRLPEASSPPLAAEKQPPPASAYVGDAACRTCHTQVATYKETAHHLTSRLPTAETIGGSFSPGSNILLTANPSLLFEMDAADADFFETAKYTHPSSEVETITERIDLVIGSGRKGRSYLYWKDDELFQLPVSTWSATNAWINSPGFPDGTAHYDRAIVPQCLVCHSSYFESLAPPVNRFLKTSLVLGILCEKCHGPGREHVVRERSVSSLHHAPKKEIGKEAADEAIINPARLPRDRQIDLCSLCHAGIGTPVASLLAFLPGDPIDRYLKIFDPDPDAPPDVHTNQVQLLRMSRCFQSSDMTCSTCHNVHQAQRNAESFAVHCMKCHNIQACGKYKEMGERISGKCIDCHMPLQRTQMLVSKSSDQLLAPLVRNHRIAIYPEPSQ
jgi:hypothetical protein